MTCDARWKELIARYAPSLRAYARRARFSSTEVEDVLWDVWQVAQELDVASIAHGDEWPFLQAIVREICRQRVLVRRHEQSDIAALACTPSESSVVQEFSRVQLSCWLDTALADLPHGQRQAVELHYCDGWTYRDIASRYQVAEATIRVQVMRGLRRLKEFALTSPPPHIGE